MATIKISISKEFSKTPGPRYISEGKFSAELFKKEILNKKIKEAKEENKTLEIDLDGTLGYGTSFLEELFGGTARTEGVNFARKIKIISSEEPWLLNDIKKYIDDVAEADKNENNS